jgi:hypothetical protein
MSRIFIPIIASYLLLTCMVKDRVPPDSYIEVGLKLRTTVLAIWVHTLFSSADETAPQKNAGL